MLLLVLTWGGGGVVVVARRPTAARAAPCGMLLAAAEPWCLPGPSSAPLSVCLCEQAAGHGPSLGRLRRAGAQRGPRADTGGAVDPGCGGQGVGRQVRLRQAGGWVGSEKGETGSRQLVSRGEQQRKQQAGGQRVLMNVCVGVQVTISSYERMVANMKAAAKK